MRILVIEDEIKLANFICDALSQAGHVCDHFANGTEGLNAAMVIDYDLVLLDLMLPSLNGFEVIKNMQSFGSTTPVIMMSALNDTEHVIQGLDLGAVDYIKKPFDLGELLARVRAAQRRHLQAGNKLFVEDLELDLLSREAQREGKKIPLSNREFALLEYLVTSANKVLTKSQILDKVWDINHDPGSNIVEVHMSLLRKKIDKNFGPPLIHTIIGRGYILKGNVTKN